MTPSECVILLAGWGLRTENFRDALDVLETMLREACGPYEAQKTRERDRKREWREQRRLTGRVPSTGRTETDIDGTAPDAVPHKDNYTTTRNNLDKSVLIQPAPTKHERRISRGTRLSDDFKPLPSILELARNLSLTDDEYRLAFDKFKDHFRAAPGSRGIKLDWQATWRNWVRETAERKNRNGSNRTTSPNGRYTTADSVRQAFDYLDKQEGHREAGGFSDPRKLS